MLELNSTWRAGGYRKAAREPMCSSSHSLGQDCVPRPGVSVFHQLEVGYRGHHGSRSEIQSTVASAWHMQVLLWE